MLYFSLDLLEGLVRPPCPPSFFENPPDLFRITGLRFSVEYGHLHAVPPRLRLLPNPFNLSVLVDGLIRRHDDAISLFMRYG